jgi:hypothetical protein
MSGCGERCRKWMLMIRGGGGPDEGTRLNGGVQPDRKPRWRRRSKSEHDNPGHEGKAKLKAKHRRQQARANG